MEPKMEQPKQYTPEEIAQFERSRTISDAELLEGGAEYVVGKTGEKENLLATDYQKSSIEKEATQVEKVKEMIESQSIKDGDHAYLRVNTELYSQYSGRRDSKNAHIKFLRVEDDTLVFLYSFGEGRYSGGRIKLAEIEEIKKEK